MLRIKIIFHRRSPVHDHSTTRSRHRTTTLEVINEVERDDRDWCGVYGF